MTPGEPAARPALVVVTGGGTAGHVVPSLPVIARLRAEGVDVRYVGSGAAIERELIEPRGIEYHAVRTGKLRRYPSVRNATDAFRVVRGIGQAARLVRRLRPDVVFSKGGFVSFPVVVGAWLNRVPVVAHESDLTPGLANRLSLPFVRTLCTSFDVTAPPRFRGRVAHTGSPVRRELLEGSRAEGRVRLGVADDRPVLLVTGGSLGADGLNRRVRAALPLLLPRFRVVHVCGAGKRADIELEGYSQLEFVREGWGDLLAAADVVVSRAGANTLFELLALRKLHVLVPLPASASRGDQLENAAYAEARGYSLVIPEAELDGPRLFAALEELLGSTARADALARFERRDSVELLCAEIRRWLPNPTATLREPARSGEIAGVGVHGTAGLPPAARDE